MLDEEEAASVFNAVYGYRERFGFGLPSDFELNMAKAWFDHNIKNFIQKADAMIDANTNNFNKDSENVKMMRAQRDQVSMIYQYIMKCKAYLVIDGQNILFAIKDE